MEAWRLHDFGDFRLDQLPDPEPGADEVLVEVRVVQPSVTEAMLAAGIDTFGIDLVRDAVAAGPSRLFGHEYCARVAAVGDEVDGIAVGDRVTDGAALPCLECGLCRSGRSEQCRRGPHVGFDLPGCLSDISAVPAIGLVPVSDEVSDADAACLQPASDCVAAVAAADLGPGSAVAVLGQGPMGGYVLQLARNQGADPLIAIDVRDETLEIARQVGADACINAREEDPVAAVRELTGGSGVDVTFESAGGSPKSGLGGYTTLEQARDMTRDSGRVVVLALLAGRPPFDLMAWRERAIQLRFPPLGARSHLREAAELAATGSLDLSLYTSHAVEGLESVPEAFEITAQKGRFGALGPCQVIVRSD